MQYERAGKAQRDAQLKTRDTSAYNTVTLLYSCSELKKPNIIISRYLTRWFMHTSRPFQPFFHEAGIVC